MTPLATKEILERRAERQGGRLHHRQLTRAGLSRDTIRTWRRQRILIRTRAPRVYALGYLRHDRVARLWDVILYAGPGAGLTGAAGAYDLGLLFFEPPTIKVATPHQRRLQIPGAMILSERPAGRELHDGLPYAPLPLLLLELAVEGNVPILRRTLEVLDYQRRLDLAPGHRACETHRPGAVLLRAVLTHRLPQLAHTRSPLEVDFLLLLEAHHLPLPRVNQLLHGVEPDMYWPDLNLVVELDGDANHGTPAQKRRDAAKDATLRAHGITVIRLGSEDVHHAAATTLATLAAHGLRRA